MGCEGPDPPDNSPQDVTPPPRHHLLYDGRNEDSDDEQNEHFGYEPLPQNLEAVVSDHDTDNETTDITETQEIAADNVPSIEPMAAALTRAVWNVPRPTDPIQMDTEKAQQVMSIMANIALPQAAIPEWAQCVSEEQWKQTLNDRLDKLRGNR